MPAIKFNPQACQKLINGKLNNSGISKFHSICSGNPNNRATNIIKPTTTSIPSIILFFIVAFDFNFR